MLSVVPDPAAGDDGSARGSAASSVIDELVREGARRMLAEALQAEVDAYIARFAAERDEHGHRQVVRNGHHEPREVLTSAGAVEVTAPRVNDKRVDPVTGERMRFSSAILPPWARKTPKITEVLPLLYLHGLSSGDFVPALGQFLGSAKGLSAAVITKLTEQWKAEQRAFAERDLSTVDYVYLWADGIHVNIRLEEAKLCLLVMIGVRADGRKELVALADGYRESTESWADLLRDCKRRGMRAPVLAVGDGALGFWGGLREVFPETREQRCWFHRSRKRSTCRRVGSRWARRGRRGAGLGGGAVADGRRGRETSVRSKWRSGLADDTSDGRSAHVAESVGENVQCAWFPEIQDGEQNAFVVADLLGEDTATGTRLARTAASLVGQPLGVSGLPGREPLGRVAQLVPAHAGQGRSRQCLDDPGSSGAKIGVQEGEQVARGAEAD
jgi:mutator family transposase